MRFNKTLASALLLVVFSAMFVGLRQGGAADQSTVYEWFDPIIVVRRFLLDSFHEEPDEQAMQRAMIDAMISTLDDPYTIYVPPAAEVEFNKALRGTYVGIGAEVSVEDGYLTIVSPLEDSPALEAGVQAGDIVLAIEGSSTLDRPIGECIDQLLGEPGTPVTIRVRHLDGREQDLTIVRQQIVTPTIKGVRREGESWDFWLDHPRRIGYVRLTQFNHASTAALREALDQLRAGGLAGLVLDLRGNPGGELAVAIETADLFLRDGLIVSVKGRNRQAQSWYAKPQDTLPEFPMVVLINQYSASASEIVAGALQENGRAKVLGTRSFGKGSVQEIIELPYDQGTLKMTAGHYYLPGGRNISRSDDSTVWGVDPDRGFVVSMTDGAYRDMILARREYEIIRPGARPEPHPAADPEWIRRQLHDEQLAAALQALNTRLQGGQWPVVGEAESARLAIEQRIGEQGLLRRRLMERLDTVEDRLRELLQLAERVGAPRLLPPETDLTNGTITLHDKDDNLIGAYRLEGGDLELALRQLQLSPIEPAERSP